jgi:hypothetical protein
MLRVTYAGALLAALTFICGGAIRLEALEAGRSIDELRHEVLGLKALPSKCVAQGGVCPMPMAQVWASGTFMDALTPGGLVHGGLTLQLSLCCNYTFKRNFFPTRTLREQPSAPTASERARYAEFIHVLLSSLPISLGDLGVALFAYENARIPEDRTSITLFSSPVPAARAKEIIADLEKPRSAHPLPITGTPDVGIAHGALLSDSSDPDGWFVKVGSFVLDCKFPRTLRARPYVMARLETAPTGFAIVNGGLQCLQPQDVAHGNRTRPFELLLDVDDGSGGVVQPYATVEWRIAPTENKDDVHTAWSRRGIRVHDVPKDTHYTVLAVVHHGAVSATMTSILGWGIQPLLTIPSAQLLLPSGRPREPAIVFGSALQLPLEARVDSVFLHNATCAQLDLPDDGRDCVEQRSKLLQDRVRCNANFRGLPNRADAVLFNLSRAGDQKITCAIRDPINACPRPGVKLNVFSIQAHFNGDPERTVCGRNTTLSADVQGVPRQFEQGPDKDVSHHVAFGWSCVSPSKTNDELVPSPELQKAVVFITVPDSGLMCRFTVAATPALKESGLLLPNASDSDEVTVKIASSYIDLKDSILPIVNFTTKDRSVTLKAPTSRGRWVGNTIINFQKPENPNGELKGLPIKEALRTHVQWINAQKPCIGHEFSVPIQVTWAPPRVAKLCERMWYNDGGQQISASYPEPDEQGEWTLLNETGTAHPDAYLQPAGIN